jgi:hypothetical protein
VRACGWNALQPASLQSSSRYVALSTGRKAHPLPLRYHHESAIIVRCLWTHYGGESSGLALWYHEGSRALRLLRAILGNQPLANQIQDRRKTALLKVASSGSYRKKYEP